MKNSASISKQKRAGRYPKQGRKGMYLSDDEYTESEVEFLIAIDKFKQQTNTPFLAVRDYLEILKELGYKKK